MSVTPFHAADDFTGDLCVYASDYDALAADNQRLEDDYKEAVANGMEDARQVHRLENDNQRLREALTGAGIWIKDVTDLVLFPLAYEVQGGLGAEADSFGGRTVELLRGIEAALSTNGEVTE